MERQEPGLDDLLEKFSIFGRYHLKFLFFTWFAYGTNSMYTSNYIFAAGESGYRCLDEGFENNSCSNINGTRCSQWFYDNQHSFVAEFQLACHEWKRTLVGTAYCVGYMVGLLIVGPLSDRIGRKKVLVLTGVFGGVFGLARSFTYSYWLYIMFEFMGAAIGDIYSPFYVLNMEIVSAKKRVIYYCFCSIGGIIGGLLLPFAAWCVPYWRNLLQVIYTPTLFSVTYIFFLDESPRWLLSNGKTKKAVAIVQKMGNISKVKFDSDALDNLLMEDEDKSIGFINLLKMTFQSQALLKRCLVCIVWWTTSTFVNYGMLINAVTLQGNKYINYALVAMVDLPGNLLTMYILTNYKMRSMLISTFFATTVLCVSQPFLPQSYPWFSVTMYMVSKLLSMIYFYITYLYTTELFPTCTRNSMYALCSSIGRIGSIIAPQTPLLMIYWNGLPSIIYGSVSLTAGLLTFLVPDTADNSVPDTVQEAETLRKNNLLQGNRIPDHVKSSHQIWNMKVGNLLDSEEQTLKMQEF